MKRFRALWGAVAILTPTVVLALPAVAMANGVHRNAQQYHILARQEARLKNYNLGGGGSCDIGVNDPAGGLVTHTHGFSAVGQVTADDCSGASGTVSQCFCNAGGAFNVPCSSWAEPIFPDFIQACDDGLGGGDFPAMFVVGTDDVVCKPDKDCLTPGGAVAFDLATGNGKCDLAPGTYDLVKPMNDCTIVLGGQYDVADWTAGKRVTVEIAAPTTLNVKGVSSDLTFGEMSTTVGAECGELRVNYEGGLTARREAALGHGNRKQVTFFTMDICAPYATLRLQHDRIYRGHFFANVVLSDFDNGGVCCGACGCFDTVTPQQVQPGDQLSLEGGCNVNNIMQVLVCGADCPIVSRSPAGILCTVPTPAQALPATCDVEGVSATGTFISSAQVEVQP
jgi:hypothetical protein